MKNPGCAFFIAVALPFTVLGMVSVLAVERWGAVAFWPILTAAFAVSVGLLRMERFIAYREDLRRSLPILCGLLVVSMARSLGLAFWQALLIGVVSMLVVRFLVGRVRPAPESPRNNAGQACYRSRRVVSPALCVHWRLSACFITELLPKYRAPVIPSSALAPYP